jgi:mannose-6-phosphate isomerase-like protein (cupin superfamily)
MTYLGDGDRSALLIAMGTQPRFGMGTTRVTVVASAAQTGGRYSLYRLDVAALAGGASPHFHRDFAEAFLVLGGIVTLYDGTTWTEAGEGDHLVVPQGGIHGFRNDRTEPGSLLVLTAPGAAREDYFRELAQVAASGATLTPREWTDLYARHDQYMVDH